MKTDTPLREVRRAKGFGSGGPKNPLTGCPRIPRGTSKSPREACSETISIRPRNASSVPGSRSSVSRQQSRNGAEQTDASPEGRSDTIPRGDVTGQLPDTSSQPQGCPDNIRGNPKGAVEETPRHPHRVFCLDYKGRPLMPAKPQKARKLLRSGEAVVAKRMPFTIRLKKLTSEHTQPLDLKLDPGSKYTGVAVVANDRPVYLAEIEHKGSRVRDNLKSRSACRRRRRNANLRYRSARFDNRTKSNSILVSGIPLATWLAPSIRNRLENVVTWVRRLSKLVPVTRIVQELVRFDLQKLENAEIQGVEYQQGTLFGYEVREYVLLKWGHKCAYCEAKDVPLELDHIVARSRGGSDRVSNLCTACRPCNLRKSNRPLEEFLKGKPKVLARIKAQMKAPLKDAAAVNSTRWALRDLLKTFGVEVAVGTGGRTKWNRTRLGVPKGHAYDALCVGEVDHIRYWNIPILSIKSIGRGSHKLVKTDAYGFPKTKLGPGHPRKRHMFYRDPGRLGQRKPEIVYSKGELEKSRGELGKRPHGFSTGDIVRLPDGVLARVVGARASGSMQVRVFGSDKDRNITFRKLTLVERSSGYEVHL